ncbi:beta-amylase 7-like [Arachis ipaensis]|uniref:Protein BZR1 homolog n=1 Tax=Arachis hypogaea TaxID=3818 RepID=A0A444ZDV6_ARAHY|nr:beta-amylase 7-like [Arachis ipaensis]XP_025644818.1 beta-amylase 7 [Arachis hypogaea]QHO06416.1 Beta-amylase [Arachis hypogaea]RYR12308.1 hypothetical protein Ahy_B04g069850 [Arachis hypogaea]
MMKKKGGSEKKRSESEKEKTKMRERKRRAITTNIFRGLRNHGGYPLSHRSDINAVLRHLANEAGFVVDPDGTTYRSKALVKCPLCGSRAATANLSPIKPKANGSASTTSLATSGVVSSSITDPAPAAVTTAAVSNNIARVGERGCSSHDPLLCFDGPISVPMYTCQDQAGVESCGANGADGVPYCEEMQRQEDEAAFLCLEESGSIHNPLVGPMPYF